MQPSIIPFMSALRKKGYDLSTARDLAMLARDTIAFSDDQLERARLEGFEQGVLKMVEGAALRAVERSDQ